MHAGTGLLVPALVAGFTGGMGLAVAGEYKAESELAKMYSSIVETGGQSTSCGTEMMSSIGTAVKNIKVLQGFWVNQKAAFLEVKMNAVSLQRQDKRAMVSLPAVIVDMVQTRLDQVGVDMVAYASVLGNLCGELEAVNC